MTTIFNAVREWLLWGGILSFRQCFRIAQYELFLRLKNKYDHHPQNP